MVHRIGDRKLLDSHTWAAGPPPIHPRSCTSTRTLYRRWFAGSRYNRRRHMCDFESCRSFQIDDRITVEWRWSLDQPSLQRRFVRWKRWPLGSIGFHRWDFSWERGTNWTHLGNRESRQHRDWFQRARISGTTSVGPRDDCWNSSRRSIPTIYIATGNIFVYRHRNPRPQQLKRWRHQSNRFPNRTRRLRIPTE